MKSLICHNATCQAGTYIGVSCQLRNRGCVDINGMIGYRIHRKWLPNICQGRRVNPPNILQLISDLKAIEFLTRRQYPTGQYKSDSIDCLQVFRCGRIELFFTFFRFLYMMSGLPFWKSEKWFNFLPFLICYASKFFKLLGGLKIAFLSNTRLNGIHLRTLANPSGRHATLRVDWD